MQDLDLLEVHTFAAQVVWQTAVFLLSRARARSAPNTAASDSSASDRIKASSVDIVTQTDEDAEERIRLAIQSKYPKHQIIGEESYEKGNKDRKYLVDPTRPCWIVDPIDGTVNFVHLFPNWCISIALVIKGKPVLGCIIAPALGGMAPNSTITLFSGVQGHGAYLSVLSSNPDATCSLSWPPTPESVRLPYMSPPPPFPLDAPKGCLFAAEWGKQRQDDPQGNLWRKVNSFVNMAAQYGARNGKGGMVHGIRSLGSAALDMAYVATGSIDIFWEGGCWEWDVAAGMIILSESGGVTFSANTPAGQDPLDDTTPLEETHLGSRLYLALRGCSGTEKESARQAQERVARQVWKRVENLDYTRPM